MGRASLPAPPYPLRKGASMSASVFKVNAEGDGVMLATMTVPVGQSYRLSHVSCRFSAAPTTSENLTVTLDANAGAVYDVLLYTVDPSAGATYSIVFYPDEELFLEGNDAIDVAFANTDHRHYGVQITAKVV